MAKRLGKAFLTQGQLDYLEALKRVYDELNEIPISHPWVHSLQRRATALENELKRSGLSEKAIDVFV